ncbi:uncharacterized protein [Solanum lycopersicum]|uniref:uncharacterized protein n=1 Tax=Solanum lycopersicum TaxID=4081 RepID=UPI000532F794|nr:uncharacterized protein LOC104648757 [Solanum lycopersicum]
MVGSEVTLSSSCYIHGIGVEYMKDQAEKKKALMETSTVVNVESTEIMIYKMGDITHFSDVRSSPVKAIVISMIDQDKDVDEVKSTDISMLWGAVDIPEEPNSNMPTILTISHILTNIVTKDVNVIDEDGKCNTPEIDEEDLLSH